MDPRSASFLNCCMNDDLTSVVKCNRTTIYKQESPFVHCRVTEGETYLVTDISYQRLDYIEGQAENYKFCGSVRNSFPSTLTFSDSWEKGEWTNIRVCCENLVDGSTPFDHGWFPAEIFDLVKAGL